MVISLQRGGIWWADLGEPRGSEPGYRRPVLVVQDDLFNRSNLATIIVLSLTSNQIYQDAPGNVFLTKADSGLAKDSIINVTQLVTVSKSSLDEYVSDVPASTMMQVDYGLSLVLGL